MSRHRMCTVKNGRAGARKESEAATGAGSVELDEDDDEEDDEPDVDLGGLRELLYQWYPQTRHLEVVSFAD